MLDNISLLIKQTQQRVASTVNSAMVLLYWNIGKTIKEDIVKNKRADYGEQVLKTLGEQLTYQFGRGYGYRNLFRRLNFYETFPDFEILTTLSSKLSGSFLSE